MDCRGQRELLGQIPPALRCLLVLCRPHLATAVIFRHGDDSGQPWRIRFELPHSEPGCQTFAFCLDTDDGLVHGITELLEAWRRDDTLELRPWKTSSHAGWKLSKLPLLSELGSTRAERRLYSFVLDLAWELDDADALATILAQASRVQAWRFHGVTKPPG